MVIFDVTSSFQDRTQNVSHSTFLYCAILKGTLNTLESMKIIFLGNTEVQNIMKAIL